MDLHSTTHLPTADIPRTNDDHSDIIACLNSILEGDYKIRLSGDNPLSNVINKLVDRLEKETMNGLDGMVDLSISASETTILSARMMQRLQEMDQRSQSIASGAEQLQASIDSINQYGESIVADVENTRQTVRLSSSAASQTVETMEQITLSVGHTMEKVRSLEVLSQEIANVAETIKSIAFQTNLLSLNANVEAAKAGEAGRGFAVVAKEVGILARRSGEATKAIDEMVKGTHAEIQQIIQSMNHSSEAVTNGQQAIKILETSMRDAQDKIEHVHDSANQISHTLHEQTSAVALVSSGIHDIARATESSTEAVTQVVYAMQSLGKSVAGNLTQLSEKNVTNRVLKLAQSDHVTWKKRLIDMVAGMEDLSSHELTDHHSCRLGKWYDQVSDPKLRDSEAFDYLVDPHRLVHHHGKQAVDLYNRGDLQGALAEITKVEEASEEVLEVLAYLDKTTRT